MSRIKLSKEAKESLSNRIQTLVWVPAIFFSADCLMTQNPELFNYVYFSFVFGFVVHFLTWIWLEPWASKLEATVLIVAFAGALFVPFGVPSWGDLTVIKPYKFCLAVIAASAVMIGYNTLAESFMEGAKRKTESLRAVKISRPSLPRPGLPSVTKPNLRTPNFGRLRPDRDGGNKPAAANSIDLASEEDGDGAADDSWSDRINTLHESATEIG